MSSVDLAGAYWVRPQKNPAIGGHRPIIASQVLTGLLVHQAIERIPHTVSTVFALCGQAHLMVSGLAIAAASSSLLPVLTRGERQGLRASTLRDHIQRMALDWPRLLVASEHMQAQLPHWASCPIWRMGLMSVDDYEQMRQWWAVHVLGLPVLNWWQAWCERGVEWLLEWSQTAHTGLAVLLCEQFFLHDWAHGGKAWQARTDTLQHIHQNWQAQLNFAHRPSIDGISYETGAWSRQRIAHPLIDNAWTRLCARLVDAVELLLDDDAQYLQSGSMRLSEHSALAWVEMARGILVHHVELNEQAAQLVNYNVLAPTEWNCHPQGCLAQTLSYDVACATPASISALMCAFDPCVPFTIEDTTCTK